MNSVIPRNSARYGSGIYPKIYEVLDILPFYRGKIGFGSPYFFYRYESFDLERATYILRNTTPQISPDVFNFFKIFFEQIASGEFTDEFIRTKNLQELIDICFSIIQSKEGKIMLRGRNGTEKNIFPQILFEIFNFVIATINKIVETLSKINQLGILLNPTDYHSIIVYKGIWVAIFLYMLEIFSKNIFILLIGEEKKIVFILD